MDEGAQVGKRDKSPFGPNTHSQYMTRNIFRRQLGNCRSNLVHSDHRLLSGVTKFWFYWLRNDRYLFNCCEGSFRRSTLLPLSFFSFPYSFCHYVKASTYCEYYVKIVRLKFYMDPLGYRFWNWTLNYFSFHFGFLNFWLFWFLLFSLDNLGGVVKQPLFLMNLLFLMYENNKIKNK